VTLCSRDMTVACIIIGANLLDGNTTAAFTCPFRTVHCHDSGIGQDQDFCKSSQRDEGIRPNSEISTNSQRQLGPAATETPSASSTMTSRICSSILARTQRESFNLSD
jgi:hypothetical protein